MERYVVSENNEIKDPRRRSKQKKKREGKGKSEIAVHKKKEDGGEENQRGRAVMEKPGGENNQREREKRMGTINESETTMGIKRREHQRGRARTRRSSEIKANL